MERTFDSGRLGKLLLACSLAGTLAACGGDDDNGGPVVATASGQVRGVETAAARNYLGIPYAAAPVGTLRWKAPAAATAWTNVRDASALGANCAQPVSPYGKASVSEDCLFLNVYTPKTPGPHPVMVWIHGGAFYLGQSDTYKPDALVAQNTVVVTLNYRLGALGFLSHPALTTEQGTGSGNYGLMDQQAALKWVQTNIEKFGGDKANVTLFGESAGGFSVNAHLAAPSSAGLFHKAIAMSAAYPFAFGQELRTASEAKGIAITTAAGCATQTVECLRTLPVDKLIVEHRKLYPSGPVPTIDGVVLAKSVQQTFIDGGQAKVPVIQGTTHDEWRLFVAQAEIEGGPPVTAATYATAITNTLGAALVPASAAYPVAAYPDASTALGALGTDAVFACNGRLSGKLLSGVPGAKVYSYEFNDPEAPQTLVGQVSFKTGSAHTSELQYLFNLGATLSPTQKTLADTMVGYFSRFARNGDPNGGTAIAWPLYTAATDQYMSLAPVPAVTANFAADHKCNIWTPVI